MLRVRVFPTLLLKGEGLVKTIKFKDPTYIGDPINAVRIFNTKEVDELMLLDITATAEERRPNIEIIRKISDECSMPLTVGGGIRHVDDIRDLLNAGVEKVAINSEAVKQPELIKRASEIFGSQAIIASIDVKKSWRQKYEVWTDAGSKNAGQDPVITAKKLESAGAGEILINSIDHDGTMEGFDTVLIKNIAEAVSVPVIACGGCGKLEDIGEAIHAGASAVTAGSFFVFHGRRRAVLINFPSKEDLENAIQ